MIIRSLEDRDILQIQRIHEKFYKEEFSLYEFQKNFLCGFVAVENDEVISAGGVRTIAEAVIVTNKEVSVRSRRKALLQELDVMAYMTGKSGYDQIHCFVQDSTWELQLKNFGFKDCKGRALYLGL